MLIQYAVTPIHQFHFGNKQNSSDFTLVIDAMDLLHSNQYDCFCLITSDSDYKQLAIRIRQSKKLVYGYGEGKASSNYQNHLDKFFTVKKAKDALAANTEKRNTSKTTKINTIKEKNIPKQEAQKNSSIKLSEKIINVIKTTYNQNKDAQGWTNLNIVINDIKKIDSDFTPKRYGSSSISKLLKQYPEIFKVVTEKNIGKFKLVK